MENPEGKDLIDFKQYFRILKKYWYVAVFIVSSFLIFAHFKVRYATPIYMVKTSLQIKDKSSHSFGSKSFLEGSSMFQPFKNIKNEIELIKSYNRIQLVVREMDLVWNYTVKGSIRDIDLYRTTPFKIESDSSLIITKVPFNITVLDSKTFSLNAAIGSNRFYDPLNHAYVDARTNPEQINGVFRFDEIITIGLFQFKVIKTETFSENDFNQNFVCVASDLHYLTKQYKNKISVKEGEKSSILTISSSGDVIAREVDFLTKLSEVYIRKELEDKNQIANNTIEFIDMQLRIVSDSLNSTDNSIQEFKEKNKIYDFEQQSEMVIDQMNDLKNKQLELELQFRYYKYLKDYLNTDKDVTALVAPSTINIVEVTLNKLVDDLVGLYLQKNTLRYTSSEKSPAYQTLLLRIQSTKEALLETTNNLVLTTQSSMRDLKGRIDVLEGQMVSIPNKQRSLFNIERRHTINDEIYQYLLQKRAEASIARAANLSDAMVVESALEDEFVQIAPLVNKIYTTYFLSSIGLVVLLIVVYGKFDNKIHTKEDIQKITGVSVLGSVEFINGKSNDPYIQSRFGSLTESFRSIRTNLQFILQGKPRYIIGVTSCISGDGKSFCSENLARIYAISGKKTLLIRGDLRKKFIDTRHEFSVSKHGLSEHLIGAASLDDIIHKDALENLYVILPGPVPPNASELFVSKQMDDFIDNVKQMFEVVVLDSPPVGLVSDYKSVLEKMDVNLYVVRYDYTQKESLEAIKDIKEIYKEAKHSVIFNGITDGMLRKYAYYGNVVDYGNQQETPKLNGWKRFFPIK
jgi:tyrosine-protein kinase Etk/Wzc